MKKKIGIGLLLCLFIIFSSYLFIINILPTSFSMILGNESILEVYFPFNLYATRNDPSNIAINGELLNADLRLSSGQVKLEATNVGSSSLKFTIFGIPIKTITVNVLPEIEVYPGGQAIGVLLRSKGVMVVGESYVEDINGHRYYPSQEAGIRVGDKILEINGQQVDDKMELAKRIQKVSNSGNPLDLLVKKKNGTIDEITVQAIKNKNGIYMIGLYVDDGVAGVGTLTFVDPINMEYGALGHEIIETNSQTRIEVREGKIIKAHISGINTGQRGIPGEKLGTFFQSENIIGNIKKNNQFGIYGELLELPRNSFFEEAIPIATISEVERGPAKIYTVVKGGQIEEFDINIDRVYPQSGPSEKGMIINIVDPKLKKTTGGIIQGMSGSPIVQNNKLVGAVTHVFVNDPARGYGIFAEWMIQETEFFNNIGLK
ncbi:SpoIVB peptidase [Natronospora cellulosivora (SeqCode)]